MSRNNQLLFQVFRMITRAGNGKLSLGKIALLAVLGTGFFFAKPYLYKFTKESNKTPTISQAETNRRSSIPSVASSKEKNDPSLVSDDSNKAASSKMSAQASGKPTIKHQTGSNKASAQSKQSVSDYLTEIRSKVYRSPAGLIYTPGSQHGHRVTHVMHHAKDDPKRTGNHGVFGSTNQNSILKLLDVAYRQAKSGKRTVTKKEQDRIVYTIDMGKRIGYVGGEAGNRKGKPAAHKIRLVLQNQKVITAFPVK